MAKQRFILQTKQPFNTYRKGDLHPTEEGYIFQGYHSWSRKYSERWIRGKGNVESPAARQSVAQLIAHGIDQETLLTLLDTFRAGKIESASDLGRGKIDNVKRGRSRLTEDELRKINYYIRRSVFE